MTMRREDTRGKKVLREMRSGRPTINPFLQKFLFRDTGFNIDGLQNRCWSIRILSSGPRELDIDTNGSGGAH